MSKSEVKKPTSDESKIKDLMIQKLEAREQLRAARAAIAKLDTKLHEAGASIADINAVCW